MPMKPIKRGIKLWCWADSTNGYLCDFDVYTGKQPRGVQHGLGYTVVSNLCQHIRGKWYSVFFDNFFTSCKLIEDLYSHKIICCGTVRQGRKEFPPAQFDKDAIKNLPRGNIMWRMKGPILHVPWMDKKPVWVAGTVTPAPPASLPEVQGRARDGTLQAVTCLPIVSTYNKYMGGVDKNDQMKSYYQIPISGKKWWTRSLFDLIHRAIYNSLVLYNESPNHGRQSLKAFWLMLAKEMIGCFSTRRKRGRASLEQPQDRFVQRHFPSFVPVNESGKRMERRCTVIAQQTKKKEKNKLLLS